MAKRKPKAKPKRKRRMHSEEFKREAVKLVFDQQLSVAEAARNLGIHANLLRTWKQRFEAERDRSSRDRRALRRHHPTGHRPCTDRERGGEREHRSARC